MTSTNFYQVRPTLLNSNELKNQFVPQFIKAKLHIPLAKLLLINSNMNR
jgi:hypothetical protein